MRTTFGYSESTYDSDKWTLPLKPPPQYIGQGNVDAPVIWEIVSTPLINCLWDVRHGAGFKCCIPQDSLKLVVYWFVDDSNIIQIDPSPITQAKYTIKLSQSGLDLFSRAPQKIDGEFSVNRTKCYLLEFKWYATRKWNLANDKVDLFLNPPWWPTKNWTPPPIPSLHNHMCMDWSWWLIDWKNEATKGNHFLVGKNSQVRTH